MVSNCLNCNEPLSGNFCSNCGQKKYTRIDRKYVLDELQYSLIHTNKGFLYSIKHILKNPGKTARSFIEGNRINHYKPILLAFILSGISAFITFKIIGLNSIMRQIFAQMKYPELMNSVFSFISSSLALIMLLLIPFFVIFTFLAFRKWGQNYYEHVVMNAFGLCTYTLVHVLLVYPLMFLMRHQPKVVLPLSFASTLIIPFVFIWFYTGFYRDKKLSQIILRIILVLIGVVVIYIMLVSVATYIYFLIAGPEAKEALLHKR